MNQKDKEIYLNIRAEQIKYFQDTRNGHLLKNPYPIEEARKIAESQLNHDLENNKLRISLEELLLLDNETCISIIQDRITELAQKLV